MKTENKAVSSEIKCPHCKFINELSEHLSKSPDKMTNREYWLITEIFVYLHNGKDYCNYMEIKNNG